MILEETTNTVDLMTEMDSPTTSDPGLFETTSIKTIIFQNIMKPYYLGTCPLKEIPLRPNDLVDKNSRPGKLQNSCHPGPGDPVPVKTAGIAGIDARPGKLKTLAALGQMTRYLLKPLP